MRSFRVMSILSGLLAALASSLVWAPAAQSHADLVGSTPASGARLAEIPTVVDLVFSEQVDPDLATVVLMAHDGEPRPMSVSVGKDPRTLTATVPDGVARTGPWQVDFRVTSVDGHPIQGRLDFTVLKSATAVPSPAPDSPTSQQAQDRAQGGGQDEEGTSASSSGTQGWVSDWLLVLVAAVVVAPLVVLAVRGRRGRAGE